MPQPNWNKVILDVGVGGGAGVVSKLVEDWDAERARQGGAKTALSEIGTYVDYGLPIAGILGSWAGFIRGDMETRVITAGSVLAGRRATGKLKKGGGVSWRPKPAYNPPAPTPPAARTSFGLEF